MVFLGVAAAQFAATTVVVVGYAWSRHYLERDDRGRNTAPKPTILPSLRETPPASSGRLIEQV